MIKLKSLLLLENYKDWDSSYWIRYSNVDFIKINPERTHNDPEGIYLFPSKFDAKIINGNYYNKMKYKLIVKLNKHLKIFDMSDFNDLNKCKNFLQIAGLEQYIKHLIPDRDFLNKTLLRFRFFANTGELIPGRKNPSPIELLWAIISYYSNGDGKVQTKIFKKAGYDGIFDDTGVFMSQEVQLIIFDDSNVELVKILPNDL